MPQRVVEGFAFRGGDEAPVMSVARQLEHSSLVGRRRGALEPIGALGDIAAVHREHGEADPGARIQLVASSDPRDPLDVLILLGGEIKFPALPRDPGSMCDDAALLLDRDCVSIHSDEEQHLERRVGERERACVLHPGRERFRRGREAGEIRRAQRATRFAQQSIVGLRSQMRARARLTHDGLHEVANERRRRQLRPRCSHQDRDVARPETGRLSEVRDAGMLARSLRSAAAAFSCDKLDFQLVTHDCPWCNPRSNHSSTL